MSPVNPNIFREYDIRGVADRDLTDAEAGRCTTSPAAIWLAMESGNK